MNELIKVTKGNDVRYFTNIQRASKYTDIPVNCIKLHLRNHPLEEKNGYVFEVIDGSEIKYKYINIYFKIKNYDRTRELDCEI